MHLGEGWGWRNDPKGQSSRDDYFQKEENEYRWNIFQHVGDWKFVKLLLPLRRKTRGLNLLQLYVKWIWLDRLLFQKHYLSVLKNSKLSIFLLSLKDEWMKTPPKSGAQTQVLKLLSSYSVHDLIFAVYFMQLIFAYRQNILMVSSQKGCTSWACTVLLSVVLKGGQPLGESGQGDWNCITSGNTWGHWRQPPILYP